MILIVIIVFHANHKIVSIKKLYVGLLQLIYLLRETE